MIKYYYQPSTEKTFAELRGCRFDAINKIEKLMGNFDWCICSNKYLMDDTYRVSVKRSAEDVHDPEKAKAYAKEKLMKKYYRDFDRILDQFKCDVIELNSKLFETPEELKNTP
jgi:hypothetical protein